MNYFLCNAYNRELFILSKIVLFLILEIILHLKILNLICTNFKCRLRSFIFSIYISSTKVSYNFLRDKTLAFYNRILNIQWNILVLFVKILKLLNSRLFNNSDMFLYFLRNLLDFLNFHLILDNF